MTIIGNRAAGKRLGKFEELARLWRLKRLNYRRKDSSLTSAAGRYDAGQPIKKGLQMDLDEARNMVENFSPEQIRHVAARLGQQSANAAPNVQSGVKLLRAVALVWLDELETREHDD